MRILVLGGTKFVGRAIVEAALQAGHDVTTFNRGQTDPDVFAGRVEQRRGDRQRGESGLDALTEGRWDAVIDVTGYVPGAVAATAELLRDRVGRYTFISTGSVYQHPLPVGADEAAPRLPQAPEGEDDVDAYYGELKVGCERVVSEAYRDAATIIRPGIVFGPNDSTDRATWWVRSAARCSTLVVPDDPEAWTQLVDARDLAAFTIVAVERDLPGPYNVVGAPLNLLDLAALARVATGSTTTLVPVPPAVLDAEGVRRMTDLPLWVSGEDATFMRRSHARAADDGLHLRPVLATLQDLADWDAGRTEPLQAGMARDAIDGLARRLGQRAAPAG